MRTNALLHLCELHNNISAESIHLALHDTEDYLAANPELTLERFLQYVLLKGIQRDNVRYGNRPLDDVLSPKE